MAQTRSESKGAKNAPNRPNPISRYIKETNGELKKVTWPTPQEAQRLTAIVLVVTIVMALFLGLLDFGFSEGIQTLVQLIIGA